MSITALPPARPTITGESPSRSGLLEQGLDLAHRARAGGDIAQAMAIIDALLMQFPASGAALQEKIELALSLGEAESALNALAAMVEQRCPYEPQYPVQVATITYNMSIAPSRIQICRNKPIIAAGWQCITYDPTELGASAVVLSPTMGWPAAAQSIEMVYVGPNLGAQSDEYWPRLVAESRRVLSRRGYFLKKCGRGEAGPPAEQTATLLRNAGFEELARDPDVICRRFPEIPGLGLDAAHHNYTIWARG